MTHTASTPFTSKHHPIQLKQSEQRPPGPPRYTAINNTLRLLQDALGFLMNMRERYGDVVSIPTLFGPFSKETVRTLFP